jgi:RNA polymerase sigma-70 factor (ECF subfamily)
MGEKERASLLGHLVARYEDLVRRLARRLGSAADAADVLQDTYVKIGQAKSVPMVDNPHAYLLRVASNIAADHRRAHARQRLDEMEISKLLEIEDDMPGPAAIAEGRAAVEKLTRALGELPERRRAIFLAARVDGQSHQAIAERFGVSVRTVAYEINRAFDHCAACREKEID